VRAHLRTRSFERLRLSLRDQGHLLGWLGRLIEPRPCTEHSRGFKRRQLRSAEEPADRRRGRAKGRAGAPSAAKDTGLKDVATLVANYAQLPNTFALGLPNCRLPSIEPDA
jgi:hypothetical protein